MSDLGPERPATRPGKPCFSSGPSAKRPGWRLSALEDACLGRSHRAAEGKAKLAEVIARSRRLLGLSADHDRRRPPARAQADEAWA